MHPSVVFHGFATGIVAICNAYVNPKGRALKALPASSSLAQIFFHARNIGSYLDCIRVMVHLPQHHQLRLVAMALQGCRKNSFLAWRFQIFRDGLPSKEKPSLMLKSNETRSIQDGKKKNPNPPCLSCFFLFHLTESDDGMNSEFISG